MSSILDDLIRNETSKLPSIEINGTKVFMRVEVLEDTQWAVIAARAHVREMLENEKEALLVEKPDPDMNFALEKDIAGMIGFQPPSNKYEQMINQMAMARWQNFLVGRCMVLEDGSRAVPDKDLSGFARQLEANEELAEQIGDTYKQAQAAQADEASEEGDSLGKSETHSGTPA